jgi:hypothetical protein
MADLDPNLIADLSTTSHPVQAITPGDAAQQAAQIAQTQQQTSLLGQQTQAASLQNQLTQMNLNNNQISAQAYMNVWNRTRQATSQPQSAMPTASTVSAGSGAAPAAAAPSANTTASPGVIDPSTPPAPNGVNPAAWQYAQDNNLKIDTTHDWYTDQDGNPISHSAGPAVSPAGRPNMVSQQMQAAIADEQQRLGLPVQAIVAQKLAADDKADALDKAFTDSFKDTQAAQASMAEAQAKAASAAKTRTDAINNTADSDLLGVKNGIPVQQSLTQSVTQMPRAWLPQLAKVGIVPQQGQDPIASVVAQINDPNNEQKLTGLLGTMQTQSPNYVQRQKDASEDVHVIAAHTDPDTGAMVPAQAFRVGTSGVTNLPIAGQSAGGNAPASNGPAAPLPPGSSGTHFNFPAGIVATGESVANGDTPLTSVNRTQKQAVQNYLAQQRPDYAAAGGDSVYTQKQATVKAFSPGGSQGIKVTALNTADAHLQAYQDAAEALNNNSIPAVNAIANKLGVALGSTPQITLRNIADTAGPEVVNASVAAGGTGEERKSAIENLGLNATLEQQKAAVAADRDLMKGKTQALRTAYVAGMPQNLQNSGQADAAFLAKLSPGIRNAITQQSASSTTPAAGTPQPTAQQIFELHQHPEAAASFKAHFGFLPPGF